MAVRMWVAIILCLGVWIVWERYFMPPIPLQQPVATEEKKVPEKTAEANIPLFFGSSLKPLSSFSKSNENMEVFFSDIGGKISRVSLFDYRQTIKKDSPLISPVSEEQSPSDLGVFFSDPELQLFSDAKYERVQKDKTIAYTHQANGVRMEKIYQVVDSTFTIDSEIKLTFSKHIERNLGYLMIPVGSTRAHFNQEDPLQAWEIVAFQNDSTVRKTSEKVENGETVLQGTNGWIAFGNRYFSTAVVNEATINPDIVFTNNKDFIGGYLRYPLVLKKGEKEISLKLKFFVGPKEYSHLSKIKGLRTLIDYGMFSFLAYPLLETLQFFYRFVRNYGIAIILLTLGVRAIFYPLSVKSSRSMKAMQKLQPQIQALKEKHKDDMTRFNQEQMALFKTHKVNPMGGCLPMLVQLPVFIALYAVLGNSLELFHAPFFGWIQDLSAKDPYYIFPVLMGLSMLAQQKLMPSVGMDPMQAKMMYLMPVVFTFIMLNLPSGLTIYIFLSTILGVIQQLFINREQGVTPALVAAKNGN